MQVQLSNWDAFEVDFDESTRDLGLCVLHNEQAQRFVHVVWQLIRFHPSVDLRHGRCDATHPQHIDEL